MKKTSEGFLRFRRNKVAVVSAFVILGFIIVATLAPLLAPFGPLEQDLTNNYLGPSLEHPLGTDELGRDILSRLCYGARISPGHRLQQRARRSLDRCRARRLVAAYKGGIVDSVIMRFMDVLLALPGILLGIAIVVVLGNGVVNTVIAVAIFSVPTFARLVRGSALQVLELDYIVASRAVGASALRIIFRARRAERADTSRRSEHAAARRRDPDRVGVVLSRTRRPAAEPGMGRDAEQGT